MKEGISMYWGGEVVSASELEHGDCARLGVVCPFCRSAVYLREEYVRERYEKIEYVPKTLSHYKTAKWDCEARSISKEGREIIAKQQAKIRGQRLAIFNKFLWQIVRNSKRIQPSLMIDVKKSAATLLGSDWLSNCTAELHQVMQEQSGIIHEGLDIFLSRAHEMADDPSEQITKAKELSPEVQQKTLKVIDENVQYFRKTDRRIHAQIVHEIADFLITPSAHFALTNLLLASLFIESLNRKTGKVDSPETTLLRTAKNPQVLLTHVLRIIVEVPWLKVLPEYIQQAEAQDKRSKKHKKARR